MADQDAAHDDRLYFFGTFCLSPRRRLLLENGEPARLGSRALEILIMLLERQGDLVTKHELTARVWPATFVVEGNLTAQIAALRRALGDGHDGQRFVVNDPGRGYRFVAPVARAEEPDAALQAVSEPRVGQPLTRVPELHDRLAGSPLEEPAFSQTDRVTVDAILQRGIRVLEIARTLVAQHGNLASEWLEASRGQGSPVVARH